MKTKRLKEIENQIKELLAEIKKIQKDYYHSGQPAPIHRQERIIEFLKNGVTLEDIEEVSNGFILYNKYFVGAEKNRWRLKGKAKWYWFKNVKQFLEEYVAL